MHVGSRHFSRPVFRFLRTLATMAASWARSMLERDRWPEKKMKQCKPRYRLTKSAKLAAFAGTEVSSASLPTAKRTRATLLSESGGPGPAFTPAKKKKENQSANSSKKSKKPRSYGAGLNFGRTRAPKHAHSDRQTEYAFKRATYYAGRVLKISKASNKVYVETDYRQFMTQEMQRLSECGMKGKAALKTAAGTWKRRKAIS